MLIKLQIIIASNTRQHLYQKIIMYIKSPYNINPSLSLISICQVTFSPISKTSVALFHAFQGFCRSTALFWAIFPNSDFTPRFFSLSLLTTCQTYSLKLISMSFIFLQFLISFFEVLFSWTWILANKSNWRKLKRRFLTLSLTGFSYLYHPEFPPCIFCIWAYFLPNTQCTWCRVWFWTCGQREWHWKWRELILPISLFGNNNRSFS